MSDYSGSPSDHHHQELQPPKRKATQAGLDGHTTGRSVKRRASKACQCCRSRKVRCNVTEHGAPCTNCRLDEVECIVSESRRKKSVHLPSAVSDRPPSKHPVELDRLGFVVMRGLRRSLASCSPFIRPFRLWWTQPAIGHLAYTTCPCNLLMYAGNGVKMTTKIQKAPTPRPTSHASSCRAMLSTVYKLSAQPHHGRHMRQKRAVTSMCHTPSVRPD